MAKKNFWVADILINSQVLSVVAENAGGKYSVFAVYAGRVFKSQSEAGACAEARINPNKIKISTLYDQSGSIDINLRIEPFRIFRGPLFLPIPKAIRLQFSAAVKAQGKIVLDGNEIDIESAGVLLNIAAYTSPRNFFLLNVSDPKFMLTATFCENSIFWFQFPSFFAASCAGGKVTKFGAFLSRASFKDMGTEILFRAQKGNFVIDGHIECKRENNLKSGEFCLRHCNTATANFDVARGKKAVRYNDMLASYIVCGKIKEKVKDEKACFQVARR